MKIIVFGASGRTGLELVNQALKKGYEVTAVVRDPDSLNISHPHLKIVKGNVMQPATYEQEFPGQKVVFSCLGVPGRATNIFTDGISNVLAAMDKNHIQRILCIAAATSNKEMDFATRALIKTLEMAYDSSNNFGKMQNILAASNADWTVMGPPMLTNGSLTEKYRIATGSHLHHPKTISRADLADCMLKIVNDESTFKTKVEIAY